MPPVSRRAVLVASAASPALIRVGKGAPSAKPIAFAQVVLGRLAFGPRPGDVEAFTARGATDRARLASWLEEQLSPAHIPDEVCDAALRAANLTTLEKPLEQLWADHWLATQPPKPAASDGGVAADAGAPDAGVRPADMGSPDAGAMMAAAPADPRRPRDDNERRAQPMREVELAAWLRATLSSRQLNEVLVGFWHDHFNVFAREGQIAATFMHFDRDVIRRHALGNFRALLEAVAQSPAMLVYLDNFTNQSGNANENFARELFELHTLGAVNSLGTRARESVPAPPEGYVDGDVYEAARCFTGWRVDVATGAFQYFEPWHDRFQKVVLGRHLPEYQPPLQDGRDVLDLLAAHPGTARFVVRKLCTKLLGAAPQPLVDRGVKVFLAARGAADQLAQVVRALVLSDQFLTQPRVAVRRPFEATVAMLRALQAGFFPSEPFLDQYAKAGQRLFGWRTPDGAPVAPERWAGSTPMLERFRLANLLCANGLEGVKVDLLAASPPSRTPRSLAQHWAARAWGPQPSASAVDAIAALLAQGRSPDAELPEALVRERLPAAVALTFMAPEFQWR